MTIKYNLQIIILQETYIVKALIIFDVKTPALSIHNNESH